MMLLTHGIQAGEAGLGKLMLVLRCLWVTFRRKYLVLGGEDMSFGVLREVGLIIDVGMMISK